MVNLARQCTESHNSTIYALHTVKLVQQDTIVRFNYIFLIGGFVWSKPSMPEACVYIAQGGFTAAGSVNILGSGGSPQAQPLSHHILNCFWLLSMQCTCVPYPHHFLRQLGQFVWSTLHVVQFLKCKINGSWRLDA